MTDERLADTGNSLESLRNVLGRQPLPTANQAILLNAASELLEEILVDAGRRPEPASRVLFAHRVYIRNGTMSIDCQRTLVVDCLLMVEILQGHRREGVAA